MSKHTKIQPCKGCGEYPVITRNRQAHHEFKLKISNDKCPDHHHATIFEHTKLKCIKEWNKYNNA